VGPPFGTPAIVRFFLTKPKSTVSMSDRGETLSRRDVLLGTGVAAGAALAGCTGRGGGSEFDESDPLVTHERFGKGSTAISYQTSAFYTPIEAESSQPAAAPAIKTQHEAWAEAHPEYRIDVSYPAFDQWKNDLLTRASQGDAPGGSTLDSFWVPDFYSYLQPLNDYVDDVDDFFPFVRETATRDGDLLAAWKYTDCRCLYYRQDLIDQYADGSPPETWEDLLAVGSDIAEGEQLTPFLFQNGAFNNLPYFWSLGGELVDDQGAPVLGEDANRQAMIRTLSLFRELVDTGVTPQRVANIADVEALTREARNDQLAMFVGNNDQIERGIKNPVQENDDIPDDRWERWKVAKIPRAPDGEHATGVGGWTEGTFLEGDSGAAAAAKDFVGKFVEPEAMGRYCEAAGLLPTRESVFENEDYFAADTFTYQQQFREFLQDGVARPAFPIYSTIATEFETAISEVLTGQASPEAATDRLIGNVDDEYDG
jgi:multiple sugar transport system substrate-binding protein